MMGKSEARRQKKLAKQKSKRADKRTRLARQSSNDPAVRLAQAESWPIVEALVPDNLWKMGIGQVFLARRTPTGEIACGGYLLDVFCLGVKSAFWKVLPEGDYDDMLDRAEEYGDLDAMPPEFVAKLIFDAAAFAQSFGFAPHPDFRNARRLLDGIDLARCDEQFEFGDNGKPRFIQGPDDSPERARLIIQRVTEAGGTAEIFRDDIHGGDVRSLDWDDFELEDDEDEFDE